MSSPQSSFESIVYPPLSQAGKQQFHRSQLSPLEDVARVRAESDAMRRLRDCMGIGDGMICWDEVVLRIATSALLGSLVVLQHLV
jgi:hypothetical protein